MHPNYLKITAVLHASAKVLLVLCIDMDILIILSSSCTQAINFFVFGMQFISTIPMASISLQEDQRLPIDVLPWALCAS